MSKLCLQKDQNRPPPLDPKKLTSKLEHSLEFKNLEGSEKNKGCDQLSSPFPAKSIRPALGLR